MLVKNYKAVFLEELSSLYDEKEIESVFYLVVQKLHNKKRIDLALHPQMELNSDQHEQWKDILLALKKQKPIQYILGETEFYGFPFLVNPSVLIPRPETEELVEMIITQNSKYQILNSKLNILDIGTGSGCIPIALKKSLPNAEVFAIDISEKALEIAKKNAEINQVEINFIQADILAINDLNQLPFCHTELGRSANSQLPTQFDIIVSNPPYVRHLEKAEINANVLDYEPHVALFVEDNDALLFYRKIAELALKNLKVNGQLYFEINQYLGKETVELLEKYGFKNVILHKDIYGNDRMIKCTR